MLILDCVTLKSKTCLIFKLRNRLILRVSSIRSVFVTVLWLRTFHRKNYSMFTCTFLYKSVQLINNYVNINYILVYFNGFSVSVSESTDSRLPVTVYLSQLFHLLLYVFGSQDYECFCFFKQSNSIPLYSLWYLITYLNYLLILYLWHVFSCDLFLFEVYLFQKLYCKILSCWFFIFICESYILMSVCSLVLRLLAKIKCDMYT